MKTVIKKTLAEEDKTWEETATTTYADGDNVIINDNVWSSPPGGMEGKKGGVMSDLLAEAKENKRRYRDYEPCEHPGCLSHISHPCENCGRVGGK